MVLYLQNKLVSLRGNSKVVDENKEPHYMVKGKLISPTSKKKIVDMNGNVLFTVRNKYWHWFFNRSALIYDENGDLLCKITKKYFTFKEKFFVKGYKDEITIGGNWTSFNMEIKRNEQVIGKICRELRFFTDAFRIEASEEDMPLAIAFGVAIDNIYDKMRRDSTS